MVIRGRGRVERTLILTRDSNTSLEAIPVLGTLTGKDFGCALDRQNSEYIR